MATERGLDRIVNFGDAVVAIAITLLVLPLVDLHTENPQIGLVDLVHDHSFEFAAFFLSFAVIGRFWVAHHSLYEQVVAYDRGLRQLNLLWLMTIAFLPFPTAMLSSNSDTRSSHALYVGTLLISSLSLSTMLWHVRRTPRLGAPGAPSSDGTAHIWVSPMLIAVALVVAVGVPTIGLWALLLLTLDPICGRLLDKLVLRRTRNVQPANRPPTEPSPAAQEPIVQEPAEPSPPAVP